MEAKKWITVYKFFDILEAQKLKAILEENNIAVNIVSRTDSAFDGVFKPSIGEGLLQVREDYVTKAESIVANFEKERQEMMERTTEESKTFKAKIYKEYKEKHKNLYFTFKIIFIITLVIITGFLIKNIFILNIPPNYKKLIRDYKKNIQLNPNNVEAYEMLGSLFSNFGYYNKGVYYYRKAIEIKPDFYRYYSGLGFTYANMKNFKEAIFAFKKAIELNPKDELSYINLGKAYTDNGEYALAIENFQVVLKLNPKNYSAYNGLSIVSYYLKDFNKMLEYALKEIELNPDSFYGYYNSGLAYVHLKSYKEAIPYFEKVIKLNPDYIEAHYYLGAIYKEIGDSALMQKQCNELIRLNRRDLANELRGIDSSLAHISLFKF